jgi:hypothetical protein
MVHPGSQWLYVISDGASREANVTSFLEFLNEGENVAFVYNATSLNPECNVIKQVYNYLHPFIQRMHIGFSLDLLIQVSLRHGHEIMKSD